MVIGIGGSNLGTKAIYDALYEYGDILETSRYPKIIFVDTLDVEFLEKLSVFLTKNIAQQDEVLIISVTKSGETTEVIANTEFILSKLKKKFTDIFERTIIITSESSRLLKDAKAKGISTLSIPPIMSGRYSVFSAVGLFPLATMGIDISELLKGAHAMRELCLDENIEKNSALASATITYLHNKKGRHIHNTFMFHPELASCGA